jgi:hypothetical protein
MSRKKKEKNVKKRWRRRKMEKIHSLENIERKQSHVECFFFFTSKKIQEEKEMKKKKIFENCVEMMRKTLPQGENSFIKFSLSTHTFTSV